MNTCIHCNFSGDKELFARKGDQYRNVCKKCHNLSKKNWARANKEKKAESVHKYYAKKVGKHVDDCRRVIRTAEENIAINKQKKKEYYQKNREKVLLAAKIYADNNKKERKEYHKQWRAKNKDYKAEQDRLWRQRNPAKINVYSNARRSRKLRAMPNWLTAIHHAQIQEMYDIAAALTTQKGTMHHVDHIHPLHGYGFSGLHVPWNLRVVTASENLSKGRNLPPEHAHMSWGR
jgi:hypothetical protein